MLQFYPIDDPGEYHIVLKYDSKPEMLFESGQEKDNPPKDVLCWSAEIDAGWVTVTEPGPTDAAACAKLRDMPDVHGLVFGTNFAARQSYGGLLAPGGADWLEGTTYEPYLRFALAFYRSESPSWEDAGSLPLADLLRTVEPRRAAERLTYYPVREHLDRLGADPAKNAAKIRELLAGARKQARASLEAHDHAIRTAKEVGDYSLLGYAEKSMEGILKCIKADFPDWPN
jgi:hypothetical protein